MGRPGMSARFIATSSGPGATGGSGGGGGGGGGAGLYTFADGSSFTFNAGGQTGPTARSISSMRSYYTSRNGGDSWVNDYLQQGPYQGIQAWTVPKTGEYTVQAGGARGGDNGRGTRSPGNGYVKQANFNFTQGETIYIVCGQRGNNNGQNGGGGGGTFVYYNRSASPLIVGGGLNSIKRVKAAHNSGANLAVIGNKLEEDIDFLLDLKNYMEARSMPLS